MELVEELYIIVPLYYIMYYKINTWRKYSTYTQGGLLKVRSYL